MTYIKGPISQIIFRNEINGYTVGIIKIKETDSDEISSTITFVGTFGDIKIRDNFTFTGNIIRHNKYGKQFEVINYEYSIPTKNDELVDFLSSDLFPIGEKTAQKIVAEFKDKTIDIILENPEKLLMIPRISQSKIDKIHNVVVEYQSTNKIVLEISKMGFSTKDALNILKKYSTSSIDKINNNIYNLIEDMKFRFAEIDNIAINNGIDKMDERRIGALIIYIMNELTFSSGDTYLFISEIYNELIKYIPEIEMDSLEYNLLKLTKERKIVICDKKIYLRNLYEAETYIVDRIYFLNEMTPKKIVGLNKKIIALEKENNIIYDDSQKKAITKALSNNITIITGGPGTGKTTIVKAIVTLLTEVCKAKISDIALLAPTGRAGKRLMDSTGIPASTIHRYLGWDKEKDKFSIDEYCPNPHKYIIVDETSMIDTVLLSSLFKGTKRDAKYIFVGDYYQLPSVSQGQVLKDLIDSDLVEVIRLNTLYRQNETSYIIDLAKEIKDKDISDSFYDKKDDYNFIECPNEYIIEIISSIIEKAKEKGYDETDIQVLAPMYKSLNGIDNLNKKLQDIFNHYDENKEEIVVGDITYREGDKVLQLVNDSDNNVYNGDIGFIHKINKKTGKNKSNIIINFDNNFITYTPDKYINFTHGYAISVHKSQGGEFKMVIMPFVSSFKRMLYNKLVYTAVTRAKQTLILVGDPKAFIYGVNNDYEERKTGIKEFLSIKYKNLK